MAFAISPTAPCFFQSSSSSSTSKPSSLHALSNSAASIPKSAVFYKVKGVPQLGFTPFSQWNGLKQSISQYSVKIERRRKWKGKGVYASLFGVGAPEALVIGVVALLVFGPKGLAEVARNLGKTLRAFQPTIKELQEVSREFKSTLEREIGLDDVDQPVPRSPTSNSPKPTLEDTLEKSQTNVEPDGTPSERGAYSSEDYLKVTADQLTGALARLQKEQEEEKAKEMEEKLQTQPESATPSQDTPQASDDTRQEASSVAPLSQDTPPQAVDDAPQEASSVASPSQNPGSNALQEATEKS